MSKIISLWRIWRVMWAARRKADHRKRQYCFPIVLALVLGGVFLFVCVVGEHVIADQDVAWHAETGRWIIAHWNVPRADPFSWTAAGAAWIDNEWLAQVAMALAYHGAGWRGLVALDGLLWVLLVALQQHYLAQWINRWTALLLAVGVMWFASFHAQMRPHMFALVCLTVWTGELCSREPSRNLRVWPLFVLWVQLHGSALLLGPIVALLLGHWRLALACAPLGLVNPYGWGYYDMLIWQFEHASLMQATIAEVRPVNARTDFARLAVIGAGLFLGVSSGARLPLARAALCFGMAGAGMLAWRGLAFFAVLAPVVVVSSPWFRERSLWLYWRALTYRARKTSRQRVTTDQLPQSILQSRQGCPAKYTTITTSADT